MSERANDDANPAPETLEGFYVSHDVLDVDWASWRRLPAGEQMQLAGELAEFIGAGHALKPLQQGDAATYRVVGQKGDLLLLHYRRSMAELLDVDRGLRSLAIWDHLRPRYGYLSVIEASLYEATGRAHATLARQGLKPGTADFDEAFERELMTQREHLHQRVYRPIPDGSHLCFYPMSKRRGEQVNWYDTPLAERRKLMGGHGRIGHKYFKSLTQVIGGSVGFDDWEWSVDLHGDEPLQFKKLIYEMRFDPASSRYAEFGPFYIGLRADGKDLITFLVGTGHGT